MSTLPLQVRSLNAKRFAAFRRNRRAWCALWALAALAAASVIAGLLCNSKPLLLIMEGKRFFPAFRFYNEHALLGNDRFTQMTDYRALVTSERFAAHPQNRVLFAPVPYGPNDILAADAFEPYRRMRLTVAPAPQVGRLNVTADGTIVRPLACDSFFPAGMILAGEPLATHWQLPDALTAAIRARFDNRAAPAFETELHRTDGSAVADVALSAYEPRTAPPTSVRLLLRSSAAGAFAPRSRRLAVADLHAAASAGTLDTLLQKTFDTDTALAQALAPLVQQALATGAAEGSGLWHGTAAQFSCELPPVSWPHRPVPGHWMGVDGAGRDVLARVLYGLRTGLLFGALLVVWAMGLGLALGAIQGFFGGWCDMLGQRLIEIWSALPFLYVMILMGSVLGRSFVLLLICYGLFNWIGISTYMRAEFLRLRGRPFVEAARCQGLGSRRLIFRHILPNALTPLITLFPFSLVGAIAALSALDFLGFGLPPLAPSWGELLSQAQVHRGAWWLVAFPSTALFVVMLLAVLIGEGLRDAFDPKPQSRME